MINQDVEVILDCCRFCPKTPEAVSLERWTKSWLTQKADCPGGEAGEEALRSCDQREAINRKPSQGVGDGWGGSEQDEKKGVRTC